MATVKSLRITDRKGVVIGTWKRGEVFVLKAGDRVTFNNTGIPLFNGKILNLSSEVQSKLIASRRVVVEG